MTHESLTTADFDSLVSRLGGVERLAASAKATGALQRRRGFADASALLRTLLLYCLTDMSFRTTAAWAEASTLAGVSSVALWKRMAKATTWLEQLVAGLLLQACKEAVPAVGQGASDPLHRRHRSHAREPGGQDGWPALAPALHL